MSKRIVRIAAHGLLKKNSKFLVTKRSKINDYMPGYWDLPGGTVEFGEKVISALKREFKEETNLDIKPGKILHIYDYLSNNKRHQFQLVIECFSKNSKIILNPKEHSDFRWVSWSELGKLKKIKFLAVLYKEYK